VTKVTGKSLRGVKILGRDSRSPESSKEETLVKTYLKAAVASAFLIGMTTAALAVTGEYDNMCTMGLASGKDIKTDCSVNAQVQGRTYCFGSQSALTQFMADPSGNLVKAQAYYSTKHPG
jgi:YHS domain-containing protein